MRRRRPQVPAQPRHVALQRACRRRRGLVTPDRIDEGAGRDGPSARREQHAENRPRLSATDVDERARVVVHLERPQRAEPHGPSG